MKALLILLLAANLLMGGWLLLEGPLDIVREPGRQSLQVEPQRLHLLSGAEVERLHRYSEQSSAAAAPPTGPLANSANGFAASPSINSAHDAGRGHEANASASAPNRSGGSSLAACMDIGPFTSEAAARKLRARLAAAGLDERAVVSTSTVDKTIRVRVTGVDTRAELQLRGVLRDFAKLSIARCKPSAAAADQ